jgi:hypothetical protein
MKRAGSTLLLMIFSFLMASEGQASEQVGLQCKFRDGWYIPHQIRIECLESGCDYKIGTKQATMEQGKLTQVNKTYSQESLNGMEIKLDSGSSIIIEKNWAGRFEGILAFGNGSFAHHEKTQCRLTSSH